MDRAKRLIHGMRHTPEYSAWATAKQRTTNPNATQFPNYGARGIRMCAEWLSSSAAFLAHVGRKPDSTYSLDRIDNDGNYEPGNVRWATKSEQAAGQTYYSGDQWAVKHGA